MFWRHSLIISFVTANIELAKKTILAAGLSFLDWWTRNRCVGTIDAAIPLKRFQDGLT